MLLGDDILREDVFGPADIMYSEGILRFRGKRIPIRTVDSHQGGSLKVVSIDTEVVPGMTEKIVDGFLERPNTQAREGDEQCMLIEADPGFSERYKVLLAPVIVDCTGKVSVAVRVNNPFQDMVVIPGDMVLGSLEPVEVAGVLKGHECEGMGSAEKCTGNANVRVRRIQLDPPSMDQMSDGLRAGKATGKGPTEVDPPPLLGQVNGSGKGQLPPVGPTDMRYQDQCQRSGESIRDRNQLQSRISVLGWLRRAEKKAGSHRVHKNRSYSLRACVPPGKDETSSRGEAEMDVPLYLADLVNRSTKGWNVEQGKEIKRLLLKYKDVFARDDMDIGNTTLVEHEIETGNTKPFRSCARTVPMGMAKQAKEAIDKLEKRGLIRKSTSPWSSPVVFVRKPNGDLHTTIDYRRLNTVTTLPASSIPRTQDCVNALARSEIFSVGDSPAAFHQVPMKESDISKTTFITMFGLYECPWLPMGLSGSPSTYQALVELVLNGLNWITCVIYLDDVIVFSKSFEEHLN